MSTRETTLPVESRLPGFDGAGGWLNSPPLTPAGLRGSVVLVDFWTYSCINCLRTLPHLKAWYAAYHSKGLDIIGVHTPEFAFEHVASNVSAAVKRLGIHYAVVQDNKYGTWTNYSNQYWPAHYLIDRLSGSAVTVTRLAHGVPVGGELDYLDDGTLTAALKARRPL